MRSGGCGNDSNADCLHDPRFLELRLSGRCQSRDLARRPGAQYLHFLVSRCSSAHVRCSQSLMAVCYSGPRRMAGISVAHLS